MAAPMVTASLDVQFATMLQVLAKRAPLYSTSPQSVLSILLRLAASPLGSGVLYVCFIQSEYSVCLQLSLRMWANFWMQRDDFSKAAVLPCPVTTIHPPKFGHPGVEVLRPAFEVRRARRESCLNH